MKWFKKFEEFKNLQNEETIGKKPITDQKNKGNITEDEIDKNRNSKKSIKIKNWNQY